MPQQTITIQAQEYTVSQISENLKRTLEEKFYSVRVRGEISGLKIATSGHVYLNLKDNTAVLNSVCWAGIFSRLSFKPEEGMEVICTGKISAYAGRSNYQLIVDKMESAGVGALLAMLDKRRKILEAEGIFAPERKRKLPFIPMVIGVVTSPTGAVIKDILHRISERFPVHVIIWPVLVQGTGAAEQITQAIEGFNTLTTNLPRPELLIVARGGGSIEDLWAFNEEIVVRAAANSKIPLISAVGHETDTTLIDYASDHRAPTPTAAAEIAVPVKADLQVAIKNHASRCKAAMTTKLKDAESSINKLNMGLLKFASELQNLYNKISESEITLRFCLKKCLENKRQMLELVALRFSTKPFLHDYEKKTIQLNNLNRALNSNVDNILKATEISLTNLSRLLDSFSYRKVLERGYAVAWNNDNQPITSASTLLPDTEITIEFADGKVKTLVQNPA